MAERMMCSVRLPSYLWRRLKAEAKRNGMKISALVELALIHELGRRKDEEVKR